MPDTPIGPPDGSLNPRSAGIATFMPLPQPARRLAGGHRHQCSVRQRGQLPTRRAIRTLAHPRGIPSSPSVQSGEGRRTVFFTADRGCRGTLGEPVQHPRGRRPDRAGRDRTELGRHAPRHPGRRPHHRGAVLRVVAKNHGPVAVLRFDAHLDTGHSYFRRASEEGLTDLTTSTQVGTGVRSADRKTCRMTHGSAPTRLNLGGCRRARPRARARYRNSGARPVPHRSTRKDKDVWH
jgi:agmatinase